MKSNGYLKKPLAINIEKDTIENNYYRHVIHTTYQNQVVLMSIKPGENIPCEVHSNISQFLRVEEGEGSIEIENTKYKLNDGIAVNIPPGLYHEITNTSKDKALKLYTIYSLGEGIAEHEDQLIQISQPLLKNRNANKNKIIYLLLL